jgi:hypothetical protein
MSDDTGEFVKDFCNLRLPSQKTRAYKLAERFAAPMASPRNINLMADGIRAALNGEPAVPGCRPHQKKGHQIGSALRDGRLSP